MKEYIVKNGNKLKIGYTTGVCACAASKACAVMLFTKEKIEKIDIIVPLGIKFSIDIYDVEITDSYVKCSVIKYSGDDPDVTNGMKIFAQVSKKENEIIIKGSEGIGIVTLDGLKVKKGNYAINPKPMEMIKENIKYVCEKYNYNKGIEVIISAPEGEKIADKTFNKRLGIVGGISILGSTGIVEPMSEKAIIDTIKTEIDLKYTAQNKNIIFNLGNYGYDFLKSKFNINLNESIKCSNFIGEAIDYAVYLNFENILIVGHIGKMVKLAGGIMNTHSKIADCRMEILSAHCAMAGMKSEKIKKIMNCINTDSVISLIKRWNFEKKVFKSLKESILKKLEYRSGGKTKIEFIIFDSQNNVIISNYTESNYFKPKYKS